MTDIINQLFIICSVIGELVIIINYGCKNKLIKMIY